MTYTFKRAIAMLLACVMLFGQGNFAAVLADEGDDAAQPIAVVESLDNEQPAAEQEEQPAAEEEDQTPVDPDAEQPTEEPEMVPVEEEPAEEQPAVEPEGEQPELQQEEEQPVEQFTVRFAVVLPGEEGFTNVPGYTQMVDAGTQESDISLPSSAAVPATATVEGEDGIATYAFDGWYTAKDCSEQNEATFNGTVETDRTYYGRYVCVDGLMSLEEPAGEGEEEPELEMYDVVLNYYEQDPDNAQTVTSAGRFAQEYEQGTDVTVAIPQRTGYKSFLMNEDGDPIGSAISAYTVEAIAAAVEADVIYVPDDNIPYMVKYINAETGASIAAEKTLYGKTGATAEAEVLSITGYTANAANPQTIMADGSTVVTITYKPTRYQVVYNAEGGTYVDPLEKTVESPAFHVTDAGTTEKVGYQFEGWFTEPTGGQKVDNIEQGAIAALVDGNNQLQVYAHWQAQNVGYTVVYWKQKVTDAWDAADEAKTYDYQESVKKTALAGSEVTTYDSKSYAGFDLNTNLTDAKVTIAPDGTTVYNVYYDRKVCTINFNEYSAGGYPCGKEAHTHKTNGFNSCYSRGQLTCGKEAHTHTAACGTYQQAGWYVTSSVKGLYGADYDGWTEHNDHYWYASYDGSNTSGSGCILLTTFDFATAGYSGNKNNVKAADGTTIVCNFYGTSTKSGRTIYYYNEQADGSYKLVDAIISGTGTLTIHEKYTGYDLYKYTTGSNPGDLTKAATWSNKTNCSDGTTTSNNTVYIASRLKTHKLSYYNYNAVDTGATQTVKYTAPLGGYASYTPNRPAALPSYYEFKGWYADPSCTVPFDFDSTMPNNNLQVYAKWTPEVFDVTVVTNGAGDIGPFVDVEAGSTLTTAQLPANLTKEGYRFEGWYLDADFTKPYSYAKEITENITIYAKWSKITDVVVTVKYLEQGTEQVLAPETKATYTLDLVTEDGNQYTNATFKAKAVNGYSIVGASTQEMVLTGVDDGRVITFYYQKPVEEYYSYRYVDAITGEVLVAAVPAIGNGMKPSIRLKTTAPAGYTCEKYATVTQFGPQANPYVLDIPCYRIVNVTVSNETVVYDGTAHGATVTTDLPAGYTVAATSDATATHVAEGKVKAVCDSIVITYNGVDVTNQLTIKYTNGSVQITPAPLTVVTPDAEKVYDGEPLTKAGTISGFVNNETATFVTTGTITEVGEKANTYSLTFDGTAQQKDYAVTSETIGTLKITQAEIVITVVGENVSETYDGEKHTATEVTLSCDSELYDESLVKYTAKQVSSTNVIAKTAIGYEAKDFSYGNANIKVTFDVTDGSLEIKPAEMTIKVTGEKVSETYDGKAHTATKVTFEKTEGSDKLYSESKIVYEAKSKTSTDVIEETAIGYAAGDFSYSDKNINVTFDVTDGSLEVTKAAMTVKVEGHTGTKTYNGQEQKVTGYDLSCDSKLYKAGEVTFNGDATAKGTDVKKYDMGLTEDMFGYTNSKNIDVTFDVTDGWLEIEPAKVQVTIVGEKITKTYDGNEYTATVSITDDSNLYTEADYTFSGKTSVSRTDAGKTEMGLAADQFTNNNDNFTVEVVKVVDGYVEILPAKVKVTIIGEQVDKIYDGNEYTATVSITDDSDLYTEADYTFSGKTSVSRTEVGKTEMGLAADQFTNNNDNFTVEVVKVVDGYVNISKQQVVVTIKGKVVEAEYDGLEHTAVGYELRSISSDLYQESDFSYVGTDKDQTAARTEIGTTYMRLNGSHFVNNNENFDVIFVVHKGAVIIRGTDIPDEPIPLAGGAGMNEGYCFE